MIIWFTKQYDISDGPNGTKNWILKSERLDIISPLQPEDSDIGEVRDTSFEGTTGYQACTQLMKYLLR